MPLFCGIWCNHKDNQYQQDSRISGSSRGIHVVMMDSFNNGNKSAPYFSDREMDCLPTLTSITRTRSSTEHRVMVEVAGGALGIMGLIRL
jgi:hypothetical protein